MERMGWDEAPWIGLAGRLIALAVERNIRNKICHRVMVRTRRATVQQESHTTATRSDGS